MNDSEIRAEVERRAEEFLHELMESGFDGECEIVAQVVGGKIARVEFIARGSDGRESRKFYIPS